MANDGSMPTVITEKPTNHIELENILKKAQKTDNIAILHPECMLKNLMHDTSCEKKITMVECSSLEKDDIRWIFHKFQKTIDNKPPVWIQKFTNWGETQSIPVIASSPTSLEELKRLIKAASENKLGVRCAGTGHSWAPIFSDRKNLLIFMENMRSEYKGCSGIRISPGTTDEVDIMTGVTTGDFKKFQLKYKLNIPANVILDVVQMVSVVATGCHGVGKDVKTPSDYVVKMRIIDAKGVMKTYKPEKNQEMFKAIQANFGCFGIIYDMTIKVIPQVIVKVENQYKKLEDVFYNLQTIKDLFEENWSVEIFWFPFNSKRCLATYEPKKDELWVRVINKEANENVQTQQENYYTVKEGKDFLSQEVLSFMSPAIAQYPSLTPLFAWSSFCTLQNFIYPATETPLYQELPHAVHFRQFIDMAPVNDMEFAFDIDTNNYKRVLDIIQVVVEKVKEYETKSKYPLNIAMEMRMMGYSDALLCPGSIGNKLYKGHGHVLYIEVLSVVNTIGWKDFCRDVAAKWMLLDGVPHLAKQWDFIPGIEDHIYKHMGVQIKKFKEQLLKSDADPNRMFLNEKLKKLLRI